MEGLVQTGFRVQTLQLVDASHKDASWNAKKTLKLTAAKLEGGDF